MKLRWNWVLAGLLAWACAAAEEKPLRMDVSGEIAIDREGAVYDWQSKSILTPEVKQLVDSAVRKWRFEPVLREGKPVPARTGVLLGLIATRVPAGYQLRIEDVRFVGHRPAGKMVPPQYPREAARIGINAMVLVAVRVGPDGRVLDAVAARSALVGVRANERVAETWRKRFEAPSVAAAKQWMFKPADEAAGDAPETTLVFPIVYRRADFPDIADGWRSDLAGPSRPIPWLAADQQNFDASGLKEGQTLALGNPVRLKTEVVGTSL